MYCGVGLKARALCVECVEGERREEVERGWKRRRERGDRGVGFVGLNQSLSFSLSLLRGVKNTVGPETS